MVHATPRSRVVIELTTADLQDFVGGWSGLHGPLDHDAGGQDLLQQAGHNAWARLMWQIGHPIGSNHQPTQ